MNVHTRVCLRDDCNGINRNRTGSCCRSNPFSEEGQRSMQRCSLGEGIAFVALMLSAGAMDSENMIVPGICCIVLALSLLLVNKKKEFIGQAQSVNLIKISVLIIARGKEKSNGNLQDMQREL